MAPKRATSWAAWDDGADLVQQLYDDTGDGVKVMPCGVIAPGSSGWFKDKITALFSEPGLRDNPPGVLVERSSAEVILAPLRG